MAIVAPLSKYKKQNFMIFIAVLVVLGGWFGYDGYFNKGFIEEHTTISATGEEIPDSDLVFNRKSPPYFFVVCGMHEISGSSSAIRLSPLT
jgi:hypothetical protein